MSALSAAFAGRLGAFQLDVALEAPAGMITALYGPSGSGKTTILRAIAGLERLAGTCRLGEDVWQYGARFLAPHRREVGYVFQEASLLPHLSVRQNLEYGLRRARGERRFPFETVVDLLGLSTLLARAPQKLSGGERQRVSLGRALLGQPRLLLLDEPMTGLDRAARDELMPYFERLPQVAAMPIVLVSHEIAEVERLASRMILVSAGRVVAAGPLNDLLVGALAGLRQRREAAAVLRAEIRAFDAADGLTTLAIGDQQVLVPGRVGSPGPSVRLRIPARDVSLAAERPSVTTILNVLAARITEIEAVGEGEAIVTLDLAGQTLLARVTQRSLRALGLAVGQPVFAQVKGVSVLAGPA